MNNTQKPWDDSMKLLVRQSSQSLVSFLLPNAMFQGNVDRELQASSVTADTLFEVTWQEEQVVLHVEFQRHYDKNMGRRLWHYNALTNIHTTLPVHSVVIYLLKDEKLVQSPYVINLPDGRPTQRLDFETIKLWEIPPETFEQEGLVGLLPLLPLTKDSKEVETVERMIDGMEKAGRRDLFLVGYGVSALVFGDSEWLKERFSVLHDILKDTWPFQEVRKEGLEEGLQQGLQQGLERGLLQFVETRFPTLLTSAKWVVEQKLPMEQLEKKLNALYQANTIEEATAALLANS